MRVNAIVAGVGMTPFGKHLDKSIKWLGGQPALEAIQDAGISPSDIEAAYVGNCAAGIVTGQESIRGQVVLSSIGLGKIPDHQRRECLRQRLHRAEPGGDDDFRGLLRRGAGARLREAVPREQGDLATRPSAEPSTSSCATSSWPPTPRARARGAGHQALDVRGLLRACWRARTWPRTARTLRHFAMVSAKNSVPRQPESARAVPRGHQRRGGAGTAGDRRSADAPDVLAPRGRCRSRGFGQRAQGAGARHPQTRARRRLGGELRTSSTRTGRPENVAASAIADAYRGGRRGPRGPESGRTARRLGAVTELIAYESLGLCKPQDIARCSSRGDTSARRPYSRQHLGRAAAQGSPGGRHGRRAARRSSPAAAGPRRHAPGRGRARRSVPQRRRHARQRHRGDEASRSPCADRSGDPPPCANATN